MRAREVATWALVLGTAAMLASGGEATVRAQERQPTLLRFAFPSIGVVPGETIRVGVASLRSIPPPVPNRVRIRLLDTRGQVVADSGSLVLQELMSEFLSVKRSDLGPGEEGTGRIQVRAVVVVSNPDGLPEDPVRTGLEVLSTATGRTRIAVYPPGPSAEFPPGPSLF